MNNNGSIHSNLSLVVSTETVFSEVLEIDTPMTLTVHNADTDSDQHFTYDQKAGAYLDADRNHLYVEADLDDLISPESYFEIDEA